MVPSLIMTVTSDCSFFVVFTARRYATAVYAVIVCLSVCLSVTSRCSTGMAKPEITPQTTPYDSPGTLVY